MTKELEIEILLKDNCTRQEAERYLKDGTAVYEDLEEHFEEYMKEWSIEEDELEKYKDMINKKKPAPDWSIVEHNGKTYYIQYMC